MFHKFLNSALGDFVLGEDAISAFCKIERREKRKK
jgi:hypothetical protein